MELEKIREHYATLPDAKLFEIAQFQAADLRPEVVPILRAEIKKRGLSASLLPAVEAQTADISEAEFEALIESVRKLPCPVCERDDWPLTGVVVRQVIGMIFLIRSKKYPMIACSECAEQARSKGLMTTLLLGWWAFPLGLFYTPAALYATFRDNSRPGKIEHSVLSDFCIRYIGPLRRYEHDVLARVEVLREFNRTNRG